MLFQITDNRIIARVPAMLPETYEAGKFTSAFAKFALASCRPEPTSSRGVPSPTLPSANGFTPTPSSRGQRRCRLVVVGFEVGGRFGTEAATFLRLLARHRAAAMPAWLRPAAQSAWVSRWAALLAVAAQRMLELPLAGEGNGEDIAPEPHELLADNRWEHPVLASRLPPR